MQISKKSMTTNVRECEVAVMHDAKLEDIPYSLRTKTVCLIALKNHVDAILYVPPDLLEELVPIAIDLDPGSIRHIPDNLLTYEMCEQAVCQRSELIEFVPNSYRDKDLCSIAMRDNTKILEFVPHEILHDDEWLTRNLLQIE